MKIDHEDAEDLMRQLDGPCWQCNRSGKVTQREGNIRSVRECDICYGTGYQPTGAGIELLNFLHRQRKRIEREMV